MANAKQMGRGARGAPGMIATLGTVVLVGLAAIAATAVLRHKRHRHDEAKVQRRRDEALADSFPASDPPATQYFDIPANRREPTCAT